MKKNNNNITPFNEDVAKWYSSLVLQSELIIYGPIKGTMFFRPYGYKIWTLIKKLLNKEFNKLEIEEVQFPLLFPESFLSKEEDHINGFAPEVFKVTKVGEKQLNEALIIRPTSETLFGHYFNQTLTSHNQLPVKLNQWVNIMRWENNTRPFLRNSEFFWQEGHTVHSGIEEAKNYSSKMIDLYETFATKKLLLPILKGEKTIKERFAGADITYSIETILKDGQALQIGTSHYLSNKFCKAFDVRVLGPDNKMFFPYQTSWGVSTRLIGAIIMSHSDDKGLVLPSSIAPYQVIILTIFANKEPKVNDASLKIKEALSSFRTKIDSSEKSIGFKSREWETKGVPIRIEIGPNDLKNSEIVMVVRNNDKKQKMKLSDINKNLIEKTLSEYDDCILKKSKKLLNKNKIYFDSLDDIQEIVKSGKYGYCYWNENKELENFVKESTGATIRILQTISKEGVCIHSKKLTNQIAIFARAY